MTDLSSSTFPYKKDNSITTDEENACLPIPTVTGAIPQNLLALDSCIPSLKGKEPKDLG
jgi:hypothetical protein